MRSEGAQCRGFADELNVREALMVMTKAKSGSLSVVNERGKLVGVFTDGDFRRHMAERRGFAFEATRQRDDARIPFRFATKRWPPRR